MPQADTNFIKLPTDRLVHANNGGLFISRGSGIHPKRVIQTWELIFVRSGTLSIAEQGRQFTVTPNTYLILHPGKEHTGTQSYAKDLSFYWLHFDIPRPSRSSSSEILTIEQQGKPRRPNRLIELMHRFLDEQKNQTLTPLSGNCMTMLILNEIADILPPEQQTIKQANSLATRAERYITTHANKAISTSDVAIFLNCNPDYLGQIFRHTFGITITQALTHQRLNDARQLLIDSQLNIDQIARDCGFQTPGYFRRVFLASEGLSPSQYRKLHLRLHINWR